MSTKFKTPNHFNNEHYIEKLDNGRTYHIHGKKKNKLFESEFIYLCIDSKSQIIISLQYLFGPDKVFRNENGPIDRKRLLEEDDTFRFKNINQQIKMFLQDPYSIKLVNLRVKKIRQKRKEANSLNSQRNIIRENKNVRKTIENQKNLQKYHRKISTFRIESSSFKRNLSLDKYIKSKALFNQRWEIRKIKVKLNSKNLLMNSLIIKFKNKEMIRHI